MREAAFLAKLLCHLAFSKTFYHLLCPITRKYFVKRFVKDISQGYMPLGVKATRHNCAVGKYSYLVAKSVTISLISRLGIALVRPSEYSRVLKKYTLRYAKSVPPLFPFARKFGFKSVFDIFVLRVLARFFICIKIPQPKDRIYSALCRFF